MCRHLAYLGPPRRLARLLFEAPHCLARQAWAPRDMRGGGTMNVDGYGVGWFPGSGAAPVRVRRAVPIWSDPDLPGLAAATESPAVLAAVRSATAGMPAGAAACAPFAADGWLFSLNGRVVGWPDSVSGLAARLPVTDLLTLEAPMDSALVWALVRDRLRTGADPASAVESTVGDLLRVAPGSRLNMLLTDSERIVASSVTHSLWVRSGDGDVIVASEPVDGAGGWREVRDGTLVTATRSSVDTFEMALPGGPGAESPDGTDREER